MRYQEIYSQVDLDAGVLSVNAYGDIDEVEYLLVPTQL